LTKFQIVKKWELFLRHSVDATPAVLASYPTTKVARLLHQSLSATVFDMITFVQWTITYWSLWCSYTTY